MEYDCPQKDQFLSNIFIVKKKDGGNRPVINLNKLNQYISFLWEREWCFGGKELCTSYYAYALTLHQSHMFLQNS